MTENAEHILKDALVIHINSFEKCLFDSLAQ